MHKKVASEIVEYLHLKFPDASIAYAGSVAQGTYKESSDIDLLFCSKDISNSYSVGFNYKGIRVGVFSFHKKVFYENRMSFLYRYHNMPISFIFHSRAVYDSHELVLDLKEKIEDIFDRRDIMKERLITELKTEIKKIFEKTAFDCFEEKKLVYEISDKIVSIFFLKRCNKGALTKTVGRDPFSYIENEDNELYAILHACLPFHKNSFVMIKEAFGNYIVTN